MIAITSTGHELLRSNTDGKASGLTVVLPAYNEAARLPQTLTLLSEWADSLPFEVEILVVDDGSDDATAKEAALHPVGCTVVRLNHNAGKGAAVRTGMLLARKDIVAFTDADLPYRLDALRRAHDMIANRKADIVYGSRDLPDSHAVVRRETSRRIASYIFRGITRVMVSGNISDTQCGLKVYSRSAARAVFCRVHTNGFAFDAEAILVARNLHLRSASMAITLINEAGSTVSLQRHAPTMLRDLLKARLRHGRGVSDKNAPNPAFKIFASPGSSIAIPATCNMLSGVVGRGHEDP